MVVVVGDAGDLASAVGVVVASAAGGAGNVAVVVASVAGGYKGCIKKKTCEGGRRELPWFWWMIWRVPAGTWLKGGARLVLKLVSLGLMLVSCSA